MAGDVGRSGRVGEGQSGRGGAGEGADPGRSSDTWEIPGNPKEIL